MSEHEGLSVFAKKSLFMQIKRRTMTDIQLAGSHIVYLES